jgi:hypothetical protein
MPKGRRKEQHVPQNTSPKLDLEDVARQPTNTPLTLQEMGWGRSSEFFWGSVDVRQILFPLPIDHRLLILVQYNVLRAIQTNVSILGLHRLTTLECTRCTGAMPLFPIPTQLPAGLAPTALQQITPHEPWIDLIPCPKMRDNAITCKFDDDELRSDLIGGLYGAWDSSIIEKNGMLVWSDPWDVRGWELTEGFVKKWGFLIRGCREMIQATNAWRLARSEEPLAIEIS